MEAMVAMVAMAIMVMATIIMAAEAMAIMVEGTVMEVMVGGATIIGTVNNQTGGLNLLKTMEKKVWFTQALTTGMESQDSRTMMTLLLNMLERVMQRLLRKGKQR